MSASWRASAHRAARFGRRQGSPHPAGLLIPPDQHRTQYLRHTISIPKGRLKLGQGTRHGPFGIMMVRWQH
jgi:hypothetical protein